MATKIYDTQTITLLDGTDLYLTPLKLKYYREFMDILISATSDGNRLDIDNGLTECALVCMKQYYPKIKTVEQLEDVADMKMLYEVIKIGGNILMGSESDSDEPPKDKGNDKSESWENLDLAKIETEVFLLGIYKDYEELEESLSLQELIAIINTKRDLEYHEKEFMASLQGVSLDGGKNSEPKVDPWEAMKARVFSGGKTDNPNDITSFQGPKAAKAGFGIGMGIDYVDMR